MTKKDLINAGFVDKLCLIGHMFFRGKYYCKFNKDGETVDVRCCDNDMVSLGTAKTIEEIKQIEKEHYKNGLISNLQLLLTELNIYNKLANNSDEFIVINKNKAEIFLRRHLPRVITGYHTLERSDVPECYDAIAKLNEDFREDFFKFLEEEKI